MSAFKNHKAPLSIVTHNTEAMAAKTGNVYKSIAIMSKRANQISLNMKEELYERLSEFSSFTEGLDEVFENREQITISRFYERLPKAAAMAISEFIDDEIHFREKEIKE